MMRDSTMILRWEEYGQSLPGMPLAECLAEFRRKVPVNIWTTTTQAVEGVWWA